MPVAVLTASTMMSGPPLGDELVQVVLGDGGIGEGVDQAFDHARAQGVVVEDLAPRAVLGVGEREDVAPGCVQGHPVRLAAHALDRFLGLFLLQGQQRQLTRLFLQKPPRHRLAHEAVPAQDQDAFAADVHRPEV